MTTFVNKSNSKIANKTIFTHAVDVNREIVETRQKPKDYEFVELIGIDNSYGAVFKACDSNDSGFTLFFGIAGDEFNS